MRVVCAYGCRPEVIKLQPVISALRAEGAEVVEWCSGQSKDLLNESKHDYYWHGLHFGIAETIKAFQKNLESSRPDAVLVQGDTATAFACALAAWLAGVPVGHVEAGLRTYASEPFPEEGFRRMIAAMARWHFCPDEFAAENIRCESGSGFGAAFRPDDEKIWIVGNPIIDTLPREPFKVLVTLHRRENWGARIAGALRALDEFACATAAEVTLIEHPNWKVALDPFPELSGEMQLIQPVPHEELLARIREADVVVTDSGGLQEEAAHFGVSCLVVRSSTERVALVRNGSVELIDPDNPEALRQALEAKVAKRRAYGAGDAGEKIASILVSELRKLKEPSTAT